MFTRYIEDGARPQHTSDQAETTISSNIDKIVRSVNYHLKLSRRIVAKEKVNGFSIYLLSKPTAPRVVRAENKNVEVSGASYTLIVLDKDAKKVGIVSGSKKEIQIIQHYLRFKTFKNGIALPRSDHKANGNTILKSVLKPERGDTLVLQSMELKKTTLAEGPSLKLRVDGVKNLEGALESLTQYWERSSVSDLRRAEFLVGTKRVGLYTYGDEWQRTCINTSTKNITTALEHSFINQIKLRLGGVDIKTTRFILDDLTTKFIVTKLMKEKLVSTTPPIPEGAEKIVVELTKRKLIIKQEASVQRKCWNCFHITWDHWTCQNCDRSNMQIVGEAIKITSNEQAIVKALSSISEIPQSYEVKYHSRKQRNKHKKSVMSVFNPGRNLTTFIALMTNKQDISYVESLSQEGFGLVAIVDPKLEGKKDEIARAGCSVVDLADIVTHLLDHDEPDGLLEAIAEQEAQQLERIFANARSSVARLTNKTNYDEAQFEVDLKNLMQALVPDVIRLGTEHTGKSVPDGYSRYGTDGGRSSRQARRLFGWDAKYSQTSTYALSDRDVIKQKRYIDWLMSSEEPTKFGKLGIYAIISNFENPRTLHNALTKVAEYSKLPKRTRVALIEDMLIVRICEWLIANWQQVIENNSLIADTAFRWFRRKQTGQSYTISRATDWTRLEAKLRAIL